jgi:hypothetical protein
MSLGMMGIGTLLGANAASNTKKELRRIADTPGIDVGAQLTELGDLAPKAEGLEARRNQFTTQQIQEILEQSIPGFKEAQAGRVGNAASLIRGELPPDVMDAVYRSGASRAVAGGYGGSGAGRNLVARDLGRTSLDLMDLGGRQLSGIIGSTPMATPASFMLSPEQLLNLRSGERSQRMQAQTTAAGAPGATAVWGQGLQSMGKSLMELAGSVGGAAAGGMCWVAREVYGEENPRWKMFRAYVLFYAPAWFTKLYARHGEAFARFISTKPAVKRMLRVWMDGVIRKHGITKGV